MKIKDVKVGAIIKRNEALYQLERINHGDYYRWTLVNLKSGYLREEIFDEPDYTLDEVNKKSLAWSGCKLQYIGPNEKCLIFL